MMPDKVYLEEGCSVPVVGFVSPAWNNPKDKENTVEYIRKDVLLEWLESKIKDLPKRGFVNCVATLSYKDVVEHINKM